METSTKPHTQINLDAFFERLELEYTKLFKTGEYAHVAQKTTPRELARKITLGIENDTACKDGLGVKRTCKHFGIPHTYTAIRSFLSAR